MDGSRQDQRNAERLSVHLPLRVVVSADVGCGEQAAITRDISSQGAYCFLSKGLAPGSQVEVTLAGQFQAGGRRLLGNAVLACVTRTDACDGFGMSGVALCFFEEVQLFET